MINPDKELEEGCLVIPNPGDLRFVEREADESADSARKLRILQRYEWSYKLSEFGWFDVPLAVEDKKAGH